MTANSTRAFTLIELLVVIGIIALLSGMVLGSSLIARDRPGVRVAAAARGVERMLLEARNLTMTRGQPHAVVFHIENAGSGRILRNGDPSDPRGFPGRHWCAIIGPYSPSLIFPMANSGDYSGSLLYEGLPRIGRKFMTYEVNDFGSSQRLAATVARYQVGDRYYLPRGTRFLALGDAEDNLHSPSNSLVPTGAPVYGVNDWSVGTATRTGVADLSDTYPRPWFGYLTNVSGSWKINAWGGYDTAIFGSGLDYECTNRYRTGTSLVRTPVVNSTNTALCTCAVETGRTTQTPAVNASNEEMRPCCDASQIGTPRPLINGYWMDFMVVFLPSGQARGIAFYNRNALFSFLTTTTAGRDLVDVGNPTFDRFHGRDDAIIVFERAVLGGTTITIAKDALPRDDAGSFASPEKALDSLLPLSRVTVSDATGGVRVIRPFASIGKWLEDQERDVPAAQRIWSSGWVFCDPSDPDPNKIRVSGALTTELLLQRNPYPWIKPKP
jgi:prepilin-type N-terminal cleavage/methylation domain-containing protein